MRGIGEFDICGKYGRTLSERHSPVSNEIHSLLILRQTIAGIKAELTLTVVSVNSQLDSSPQAHSTRNTNMGKLQVSNAIKVLSHCELLQHIRKLFS